MDKEPEDKIPQDLRMAAEAIQVLRNKVKRLEKQVRIREEFISRMQERMTALEMESEKRFSKLERVVTGIGNQVRKVL